MTEPDEEGHDAGAPVADAQARRDELRETYRQQLIDSIGGWQGALITAIPPAAFVAVNAIDGLHAAIWSSLGIAALLVLYRLWRKQSVQQAVSGALGVGVAALIAARTGQARGYFLLGIWASFVYAVPLVVSVLCRRPLVGLVWEFLDPSPHTGGAQPGAPVWYRHRVLVRAYIWATLVWTALFLARGCIQLALYHRDATGWLAFARISMGYPLTIAALGVTFLIVTRARRRVRPHQQI